MRVEEEEERDKGVEEDDDDDDDDEAADGVAEASGVMVIPLPPVLRIRSTNLAIHSAGLSGMELSASSKLFFMAALKSVLRWNDTSSM